MLTLHNNHISGNILHECSDGAPFEGEKAIVDSGKYYYSMVLLSNLLWTDTDGLPKCIDSLF